MLPIIRTPIYSFTAPRITNEDVLREKANLSEAEIREIVDDLFGKIDVKAESNDFIAKSLTQFREAMLRLPEDKKTDYLEALRRCPHLVEKESNPILFLRSEDYNVEAASIRLAKYWEMRCHVFGARAYLPMKSTGYGALSSHDLEKLQRCPTMLLGKDVMRRPVIYHNKPRIDDDLRVSRQAMLRCFFYVASIALEDEDAQRLGVIVLADNRHTSIANFDRKYHKFLGLMMNECLPLRIRAFHIVPPLKRITDDFIYPIMRHLFGHHLRQRLIFHFHQNLVEEFQQYGMSHECVPIDMGGNASNFETWLTHRQIIENEKDEDDQERGRK